MFILPAKDSIEHPLEAQKLIFKDFLRRKPAQSHVKNVPVTHTLKTEICNYGCDVYIPIKGHAMYSLLSFSFTTELDLHRLLKVVWEVHTNCPQFPILMPLSSEGHLYSQCTPTNTVSLN